MSFKITSIARYHCLNVKSNKQKVQQHKKCRFTFVLIGNFVGFVQNLRHHGATLGVRNEHWASRLANERRGNTSQKWTLLSKLHRRKTSNGLQNKPRKLREITLSKLSRWVPQECHCIHYWRRRRRTKFIAID